MMESSDFAPKLGSLFSGSGGFELAGTLVGITPVWASEIEPFAIKVTAKRFPEMAHLGDITAVDGAKIEPVDVITFGSPCQGLSCAGLQKGLSDERSGLFLEAIRIIKEMRSATNGKYPAFAVWENVPGAFSSNKGEDFYKVVEEFCKISSTDVSIPRPEKRKGASAGLHWRDAGNVMGNGYSLAWRCLDAKFWGVPQRRKRIFLVADFGGQRAAEILFKREGLRRYFTPSKNPWQGAAGTAENGVGECGVAIGVDAYNLTTSGDIAVILTASSGSSASHSGPMAIQKTLCFNETQITSPQNGSNPQINAPCHTLSAQALPPTICIAGNTINRKPENGGNGAEFQENLSYTLNTVDRHAVAYDCRNHVANDELSGTLQAKSGVGTSLNYINPVMHKLTETFNWIIRRLTPTECASLQGFPKWWCADVTHADEPEYKMWGNGVALPCVLYVMEGIADALERKSNGTD